jgi:hypothetical protein
MTGNQKLMEMMEFIAALKDTRGIKQKGGKLYTTVADRVEALRRFGDLDFSIETSLVNYQPGAESVTMKAIVRYNGETVATGHAEEWRKDGYVNQTSALENAETSAIGRALAALGLHGGEYASFNEIEIAEIKRSDIKAGGKPPAPSPTKPELPAPLAIDPFAPAPAKVGTISVVIDPPAKDPQAAEVHLPLTDGETEATIVMDKTTVGAFIIHAVETFLPECKTKKELIDFWTRNAGEIMRLEEEEPVKFAEIKAAFTKRKEELK